MTVHHVAGNVGEFVHLWTHVKALVFYCAVFVLTASVYRLYLLNLFVVYLLLFAVEFLFNA